MNYNPKLIALAQAVGLTAYVALVATILQNMQNWFKPEEVNEILLGIMMLLLFVTSALISASLILGYPAMLILKGKVEMAIKIVLQSVGWLFLFLVIILLFAFLK